MIIVAHRGNLDGPNPEKENSPKYIDVAIDAGFDVEVDLRYINGRLYLGHDKDGPKYEVTMGWLYQRKDKLWIHCKNREAIDLLSSSVVNFHYFWHERDEYTMTSKGIALVLVGQIPFKKSIIVLPESIGYYNKYEGKYDRIRECMGICTDKANFYKKELVDHE